MNKLKKTQEVINFFEVLMDASHLVQQYVEKVFLSDSGITLIQYGILRQLAGHGGSVDTMTDLWSQNHTTRGNLTGVINRMIHAGLVVQHTSERDKRQKSIVLTPLGREKFASINEQMNDSIQEFHNCIGDVDLPGATHTLTKIRDVHLYALSQLNS